MALADVKKFDDMCKCLDIKYQQWTVRQMDRNATISIALHMMLIDARSKRDFQSQLIAIAYVQITVFDF